MDVIQMVLSRALRLAVCIAAGGGALSASSSVPQTATSGGVTVSVGFGSEAAASESWDGLNLDGVATTVANALDASGSSGVYNCAIMPGSTGTVGARPCTLNDPQNPAWDRTFILYPEAMLDALASESGSTGSIDHSALDTPEGMALVADTAIHEAAHDCLTRGGRMPCTQEQAANPHGDPCQEMAADHATVVGLCELVGEACDDFCEKKRNADTPPSTEQQECLDEIDRQIKEYCKRIEKIRDRYDGEKANEKACLCLALNYPTGPSNPPLADCPDAKIPSPAEPSPGGDGDGPANHPECDYPEGYDKDLFPKCDKCDGCGCPAESEEDDHPDDGGGQ